MATNLYQVLGLEQSATVEDIRKAYKKKALQTHPDRLPQAATEEDKKVAEEKFRAVNQAYEILTDVEKRREYDMHGVWPPPDIEDIPRTSSNRPGGFLNDPFAHPFFTSPRSTHHHYHHHPSFTFTDPFSLFDSIFGEAFGSRGFGGMHSSGPFSESPFERLSRMEREVEREVEMRVMSISPFGAMTGIPTSLFSNLGASPQMGGGGGRWVSESYSSQSINGVTRTVHRRRDMQGNEHVTQTFPDGREIFTINGVEQPTQSRLQNGQGSDGFVGSSQPRQQVSYHTPAYSVSFANGHQIPRNTNTYRHQHSTRQNTVPAPDATRQRNRPERHHTSIISSQHGRHSSQPPHTTPNVHHHKRPETSNRSNLPHHPPSEKRHHFSSWLRTHKD